MNFPACTCIPPLQHALEFFQGQNFYRFLSGSRLEHHLYAGKRINALARLACGFGDDLDLHHARKHEYAGPTLADLLADNIVEGFQYGVDLLSL